MTAGSGFLQEQTATKGASTMRSIAFAAALSALAIPYFLVFEGRILTPARR